MNIIKWAAVGVTALFALLNLGAVPDSSQAAGLRILVAVLGVAGVAAAAGLATGRSWGRTAVIAVGALNLAGSIVSLFVDAKGLDRGASITGMVLGLGCVALGALAQPTAATKKVAA